MLTLYHHNLSVCAQKVRLALAEKGLDWEDRSVDLMKGEHLKPDYIALNPKGVVPTLVQDDFVLTESIVINEYLDDAFRETPLMPETARGRARVRWWTKQIDDSIFPATGIVSMSIAFHHQYPAQLVEELTRLRGPAYGERFAQLRKGVDNPNFPAAIRRLDKMVEDMDSALSGGPWLVGDAYTLADVAFAAYVTRLDQLKFGALIHRRPNVTAWYGRMASRPAYEQAVAAHFNSDYLTLMAEKGGEAWPDVDRLVAV